MRQSIWRILYECSSCCLFCMSHRRFCRYQYQWVNRFEQLCFQFTTIATLNTVLIVELWITCLTLRNFVFVWHLVNCNNTSSKPAWRQGKKKNNQPKKKAAVVSLKPIISVWLWLFTSWSSWESNYPIEFALIGNDECFVNVEKVWLNEG